jgi:hypothetical protein
MYSSMNSAHYNSQKSRRDIVALTSQRLECIKKPTVLLAKPLSPIR